MRRNSSKLVRGNSWKQNTLPIKSEDQLQSWAADTLDCLSKHTKRQEKRQLRLETDLNELMKTFDDLAETSPG